MFNSQYFILLLLNNSNLAAKLLILNGFCKYFHNYFLLFCFYYKSNNLLPFLYKKKTLGSQSIPTVGMPCSHCGNVIFPLWEQFFYLMEVLNLESP